MTDSIEQQIQAKGLTAPRVTPADIEANIQSEHYFTARDGVVGVELDAGLIDEASGTSTPSSLSLLTFCVLMLRNGFTVTGESACASPENFDAEIGRSIARRNAVDKIWPLMGYELKTQLAAAPTTHVERMQVELAQLEEKIFKLEAFSNTEAFQALPELERTDLLDQYLLMDQYRKRLDGRLKRAQAPHAD